MEAEFDGFTFIKGVSGRWICVSDGPLPPLIDGKFETLEDAEAAVRRHRARQLVDEVSEDFYERAR